MDEILNQPREQIIVIKDGIEHICDYVSINSNNDCLIIFDNNDLLQDESQYYKNYRIINIIWNGKSSYYLCNIFSKIINNITKYIITVIINNSFLEEEISYDINRMIDILEECPHISYYYEKLTFAKDGIKYIYYSELGTREVLDSIED